MNHKEKIAHLEKLTIAKDADFRAATDYFLTLSDDISLMKYTFVLEERHAFFKALLQPVIKRYGKKISVEKLYLMYVKDVRFAHGFAMLSNGVMVGFYFFEAIQTGMAFIGSLTEKSDFFRLTAFETTDAHQPSVGNEMVSSNIGKTYH